jgi:hypothetical protein
MTTLVNKLFHDSSNNQSDYEFDLLKHLESS